MLVLCLISIILLNFGLAEVCGVDQNTYPSIQEAKVKILHCDACGACSNTHDIGIRWLIKGIYNRTRNSLTATTTQCAYLGLIGGERLAARCMQRRVGFTSSCNTCWMENIMCDIKHCTAKCLKCKLGMKCDVQGGLDACLRCDEEICGPAFKKCAGANRRRSGIRSDIQRSEESICPVIGK